MANLEPKAIVYRATNVVNGHSYVGFTTQGMRRREYSHRRAAKVGGGFALHAAIRKYGQEAFKFEEIFDFDGDVELALAYESELIDAENPAYNVVKGDRSWKGAVVVETARKRVLGVEFMRSNKGQKRTAEQRAAQSAGLKKSWVEVRKGFKHSEESKARMSATKKGSPGYWTGKKRPQIGIDQGKKVVCLDDGLVFDSIAAAERHYGLAKDHVGRVARGERGATKGWHFKFLGDA